MKNSKSDFILEGEKISIGGNRPCYIIAEIGINHSGDYFLAKKMIKTAFECGANAAKLQIVDPEESYSKKSESYKIFSQSTLTDEEIFNLVNNPDNKGLVFATPGDFSSLKKCVNSKMQLYKISSGLINNYPLINKIVQTNKPLIISTGMADLREVKCTVDYARSVGAINIALLQCTSIYPAPIETLNLLSIKSLKEKCKCVVGYSDHSLGWLASSAAVAMGAKIIEKHFTLDTSIPGADHKISLNPSGFMQMVKEIRSIERMFGSSKKYPNSSEIKNKNSIRRFCVAKKKIRKGEKFTLENIVFKRLGSDEVGLEANEFNKIENKIAEKDYTIDDIIYCDK